MLKNTNNIQILVNRSEFGPEVKLNWEALPIFSEKPSTKSAVALTKGIKRPKRKSTHKTPCCEASEGILLWRKGLAGEQWQGSSL